MSRSTEQLDIKARMFRGFADPTRLGILEVLRSGERTVGDIARALQCSQPSISNHLACLKECGLVIPRRDGKNIYYRISSNDIIALLEHGDNILAQFGEDMLKCSRYEKICSLRRAI